MSRLTPGQEIEAVVVAVTNDCVFIDLNAKSEGIIDKAEFTDKEGQCSLKEGDKVKAFFTGERGGEMRFTTKLSADKTDNSMLEQAWQSGIPVEGKVEKDFFGRVNAPLRAVNNKVIVASDAEVERNPRARSAKLRIAELV